MSNLSFFLSLVFIFSSFITAPKAAAASSLEINVSTPVLAGNIPQGAQRVKMLTIQLQAGCEADVAIGQIRLKHAGRGGESDIERVYAYQNNRRVTRTTGISTADQSATLRLMRFLMPACSTATLDIFADFSATAASGGEHRLEILSGDGVMSNASVVNVHTTTTATITTTPSTSGMISVTYPSLNKTVSYGASRTVARVNLQSDSRQNYAVSAITFTNDGKAQNTDIQNIRFETNNGKQLGATLPSLNGNVAMFTFDPPLLLEKNQTRSFVIKADVRASRKKTIRFIIEEPGDIEASSAKQRSKKFQ